MKGGVAGFSCDLRALPQEFKEKITVIEYFDAERSRIVIHVFTKIVRQTSLTVYPFTADGSYIFEGKVYSAKQLKESGIAVRIGTNCGREIILTAVD